MYSGGGVCVDDEVYDFAYLRTRFWTSALSALDVGGRLEGASALNGLSVSVGGV